MGRLLIEGIRYDVNPCPFCGRYDKLEFTRKENYERNYDRSGSAALGIHCDRCSVDMYETSYKMKCYEAKMNVLLEKWNRRRKITFSETFEDFYGCSNCEAKNRCYDAFRPTAPGCNKYGR